MCLEKKRYIFHLEVYPFFPFDIECCGFSFMIMKAASIKTVYLVLAIKYLHVWNYHIHGQHVVFPIPGLPTVTESCH